MEYATFSKRLLSYLIDCLCTSLLSTPLLVWYIKGLFGEESGLYLLGYSTWLVFGLLLIRMVFLIGFWVTQGGPPGYRLLHLRLISSEGKSVTFGVAVLRYFWLLLSTIFFCFGWIPLLFTKKKQAFCDLMATTVVIVVHTKGTAQPDNSYTQHT